jgi:nickel-dependent lactate racemase
MPEIILSASEKRNFEIPKGWTVLNDFSPKEVPVREVNELMEDRIGNPIGSRRLEDFIRAGDRVVLLIDDYTRSTPHEIALSFMTNKLKDIGVQKQDLDIIVASATHTHAEEKELGKIYGEAVYKEFGIRQHNCRADDMVEFAKLSDGTSVKINALVAKADVCIGIGVLEPHPFNGFGGGYKIIFPGVVDYESIVRHHGVNFLKGCGPGNIGQSNYFFQEIKAVGEKSPLQFVINFIVNEKEEPIEIVAGHPLEAYMKGVELVKEFYGTEVEEEADITITSAYPYDVVTQTFKPISTAYLGTKEGGEVILGARVSRGPELEMLDHFERVCHTYEDARGYLEDFQMNKLAIPGAPIDMNIALAYVMCFNSKLRVTYASEDMTKEEVEKLGFEHARSVQEAIERSFSRNPSAKVNIYSVGGLVLPLKEKNIL